LHDTIFVDEREITFAIHITNASFAILMKTYRQEGNTSLLTINHKTSAKVFVRNIVLIKGDANYSTIYMDGGKEKLVSHTIKFYENHLENFGFLRVHRGYIINPHYLKTYNPEDESIVMQNGLKAVVSRRKKYLLRNLMNRCS
jgi:DNA-binding LytR/AlgR family response regulator